MDQKSLQTLEFNKIVTLLEQKAISVMGKEMCKKIKPFTDVKKIRYQQKQTSEALAIILKRGSLPLGGIKDIRESLKRVSLAGVLSIPELLYIADFLYVCKKVVAYSKIESQAEVVIDILQDKFELLVYDKDLESTIKRAVLSETELADDASPELSDIRRNIKISQNRIKNELNSIIQSQTYKNMLQDNVVTTRNGRYCVPIKQEYRTRFPGMTHDQSATGATLFIEPAQVVQLNNKIKELESAEKTEIEKILRQLSQVVHERNDLLSTNLTILTELDFIFAKGEFSLQIFGTEPTFNTKRRINIKKARHPLLSPESVVPTDVYLGDEFTTLLITGPNTGGKTVALKTIGLFTLMGQSGLHIPASEGSELAVFNQVFADIGDEQSIEQSLSTFSAHMTNIVRILNLVTKNSLVLLDELGAGTDPTEGAALAISILQFLYKEKVRTAVTTHYSELKIYALSTEGVENACCEFDIQSLMPTYKLLIGIPGKSNAFAISKKLGLQDEIIDGAKGYISHEDARFEDVISDLEWSKKTAIVEKDRAEEFRREAEILKKELETQKQKLALQKEKILSRAREEARNLLELAKAEADSVIKELTKVTTHNEAEKQRQVLNENINKINKSLQQPKKKGNAPKNLKKGDRVYIYSMNQNGTIINPPDTNGDVMIQAGILKIKINVSDLSRDTTEEQAEKAKYTTHIARSMKNRAVSQEVDLRGCMREEGIEKADKFLDDAVMAGLSQVTIIHGKGTGALREAIQIHLKRQPHVKSFRYGKYGEGETGVTIVELK